MDRVFTALVLTVAIFSYRTVLVGSEPGGGKEANQLQQLASLSL